MKNFINFIARENVKKLMVPLVKIYRDVELVTLLLEEIAIEVYDEFQEQEDALFDETTLQILKQFKIVKESDDVKKINSPYNKGSN
jgi:hypothetical protein